ncbi:MAG: hypothetical protein QM757_12220 [Paludibaculum sp.]
MWQWNHLPDDAKWSLRERPGYLRLHSMPAPDFWMARNTLTQRAIGPESTATAELDASGLIAGDVAGLALLNLPYSWIGVTRQDGQLALEFHDQRSGNPVREALSGGLLWLRVHCDFDRDIARFSYSLNGKTFKDIGPELPLAFQLKTFQGVRFALFHFNSSGLAGGQADFNEFSVVEPRPRGLTQPIPVGGWITLADLSNGNSLAVEEGRVVAATKPGQGAAFRIVDRGRGRIALRTDQGQFVSVSGMGRTGSVVVKPGPPGNAETFQMGRPAAWGHDAVVSRDAPLPCCAEGSGTGFG